MPIDPIGPRVQGVGLIAYVGKGIDLASAARLAGTYSTSMGSPTHDVYDLPVDALHPHVKDLVPATIASDPAFTLLRLYVPRSQRGQITDIGIVNGAYRAPGAPLVPRNGPIYTAPADAEKYRNVAPARAQRAPDGATWRPQMDGWAPGPGDRFKVVEIG
jgi:hypothetical protein